MLILISNAARPSKFRYEVVFKGKLSRFELVKVHA